MHTNTRHHLTYSHHQPPPSPNLYVNWHPMARDGSAEYHSEYPSDPLLPVVLNKIKHAAVQIWPHSDEPFSPWWHVHFWRFSHVLSTNCRHIGTPSIPFESTFDGRIYDTLSQFSSRIHLTSLLAASVSHFPPDNYKYSSPSARTHLISERIRRPTLWKYKDPNRTLVIQKVRFGKLSTSKDVKRL